MVLKLTRRSPHVTSLREFFRKIENDQPAERMVHVYRGHPNQTHVLRPSLFRKKEYRRDEKNILRELISIQPNEFRDDRTVFEQLVRMQHYSLPTRLLDITYNPLVALYFTCSKDGKIDGDFVRLSVPKSSIKYFDSDTVSCVANLSNLTGRQRDQIRSMSTSDELKDSDVGERLLHFIQAEKPYFLPKIKIEDLKSIFAVKPKQTNQRILAQQGAFLLFGLKTLLAEQNDFDITVRTFKVPAEAKQPILKELDGININASTLFPEIESAAKYIMSKITPVEEGFEQAD
ncbi:MAG: FRG domain-containing protein [Mesorhizobium sp.]|nr:MAG: FRG domain-containing protein [Mesorhizobium sp.]TIO22234.1 MAG: FRG domain-containing protein [Mesorhizobium sp.]TJV55846.1 MAG: FRG domain-containing protein [Mesorhizobium sp.]